MDLGSVIGSAFSGGLFGVVGSIASAFVERQKQKDLYAHTEAMGRIQLEQTAAETKRQVDLAGIARDQAADATASADYRASQASDRATYSEAGQGRIIRATLGFVDVVRGLIRPCLTIYLAYQSTTILSRFLPLVGGLPTARIADLSDTVVLGSVSITSTCITWWFGSRMKVGKTPT